MNLHRTMKALSVLIFLLGVMALPVHAQGELETLLVSGVRQPADQPVAASATRIATANQLPGLRLDSGELLQGLPGVQADSRSNYAQDTRVTLRGFGARSSFGIRGVDLLLDGIPLTTPDGQGQLSSVYLNEISSSEVITGPLAALYGNGAGGVISLRTRAPETTRWGLGVNAGENNLVRQSVDGQWREGKFAARVQATQLNTDGDRPHASAEREQAGGRFYYTADTGMETIVRIDSSHDPLLEDPLGLTPEQWQENPQQVNARAELFNTRKSITHRQASLTLRQTQGDNRWQTSLWQGTRDITQYLAFTGDELDQAGGVVDLQRDFAGASGNLSRDFSLLNTPASFTLGAEFAQSEDRRHGYVNDFGVAGDLRRDDLGDVTARDVYGLLRWQPRERWQIFGGVRHSDVDFTVDDYFIVLPENPDDSGTRDYSEGSSAVGVTYLPGDNWSLFASLGRGFETPTLTEMAYSNDSSGLNTALEVSRNHQQELGFTFKRTTAELTVTLFNIDSDHEIVVDQSIGGRTTYRNAAQTVRNGVELSGAMQFSDAWNLRFNLNYLDASYSAGEWDGNRLPGVARQNHYLQLNWQPLLSDYLTLSLALQHRGKVATDDDNSVFAPAATTADFAISSQANIGRWKLAAWSKFSNLSDETYVGSVIVNASGNRAFEPAPGRNLSAGLTLHYLF